MGLPTSRRLRVGNVDSSVTESGKYNRTPGCSRPSTPGSERFAQGAHAARVSISRQRTRPRRRFPLFCRIGGDARRPARMGEQSSGRPRRDLRGRRRRRARAVRAPRAAWTAGRARGRGRDRRSDADGTRDRICDQMNMDQLKAKIRNVPDFPKAGILFYDITTLLQDAAGFRAAIDSLAVPFENQGIDIVVGIESRGFIFGSAVADRIGAGFTPVRKPGKLPSRTVRASYALEYGSDCLEIHEDAVRNGQRVLIVDDLLATGGTARATTDLVKELGGEVYALAFLIELAALNGRQRLAGEQVHTVLKY